MNLIFDTVKDMNIRWELKIQSLCQANNFMPRVGQYSTFKDLINFEIFKRLAL